METVAEVTGKQSDLDEVVISGDVKEGAGDGIGGGGEGGGGGREPGDVEGGGIEVGGVSLDCLT